MTDEKKPDGYVAWHPDSGLARWSLTKDKIKCQKALVSHIKDYKLDGLAAKMQRIERDTGWRIRPVKLVFLDEGEGEE